MRTRSQARLQNQQTQASSSSATASTTTSNRNEESTANNRNNNKSTINRSSSTSRLNASLHQTQQNPHQNRNNLKNQIKKATQKFEKACKQLILLDQKISDLQNSYTSSIESDRKTFKIVYRMQLATLEGTHEAYIDYIERKVEEIRQLKRKLFGEPQVEHLNSNLYDDITPLSV
jgi:type VI protein secretion system component VasK